MYARNVWKAFKIRSEAVTQETTGVKKKGSVGKSKKTIQ